MEQINPCLSIKFEDQNCDNEVTQIDDENHQDHCCDRRTIKNFSSKLESNFAHKLDNDDDHNGNNCSRCDSMKRMISLRDRAIMKLVEDRDQLKLNLTKVMNQNIELSRELLKFQKISKHSKQSDAKLNQNGYRIEEAIDRNKEGDVEQIDSHENLLYLQQKCSNLENVNRKLRRYLYSLRNIFAELGNADDSGRLDEEAINDDDFDVEDFDEEYDEEDYSNNNNHRIMPNRFENIRSDEILIPSEIKQSPKTLNKTYSLNNCDASAVEESVVNHQIDQVSSKIIDRQTQNGTIGSNPITNQTIVDEDSFRLPRSDFDLWYNS